MNPSGGVTAEELSEITALTSQKLCRVFLSEPSELSPGQENCKYGPALVAQGGAWEDEQNSALTPKKREMPNMSSLVSWNVSAHGL